MASAKPLIWLISASRPQSQGSSASTSGGCGLCAPRIFHWLIGRGRASDSRHSRRASALRRSLRGARLYRSALRSGAQTWRRRAGARPATRGAGGPRCGSTASRPPLRRCPPAEPLRGSSEVVERQALGTLPRRDDAAVRSGSAPTGRRSLAPVHRLDGYRIVRKHVFVQVGPTERRHSPGPLRLPTFHD